MKIYSRSPYLKFLKRNSDEENGLFRNENFILPSLREFPSTRFYGSKRKQISWLASELSGIEGQTALDAFGGTGAVSFLLDCLGWSTTYNDIFEFNTISARAIFSQSTHHVSKSALEDFVFGVESFQGFISQNFSGLYFTDSENEWLDGAMHSLSALDRISQDLFLYLIFQACLKKRPFNLFHRANLHLRESIVPVKFGNRTTWKKPFAEHMYSAYSELRIMQLSHTANVSINPPSCAKKIRGDFDLVYVDPPYFKKNKRNTDTYLQRYHFLEGLARHGEWAGLIDQRSSTKTIAAPYREEISNKEMLISDLEELIATHRNAQFVLSYVSDEDPTEEELHSLFKKHFDKVRLSRRSFNKVLSNKKTFELLLIGR